MMKTSVKGRGVMHRTRAGSAMVMAVFMLMIMVGLAGSFLMMGSAAFLEGQQSKNNLRAFYVTEAGLSEAFVDLSQGGSGNLGTQNNQTALGTSSYWVTATDLGAGQTSLLATGSDGRVVTRIEMVVSAVPNGLFQFAAFGDERVEIRDDVLIDSYDSGSGDYASQATSTYLTTTYAGSEGNVGSNEEIEVRDLSTVFGGAQPGPGYSVSVEAGAYIAGATAPAAQPITMPPIVVPVLVSAGDLELKNTDSLVLGPGSYRFDNFLLEGSARLEIQGPAVLVVDDAKIKESAEFWIDDAGGGVDIYVTDHFDLEGDAILSATSQLPASLSLWIDSDENAYFRDNSVFRGTVYAPGSRVRVRDDALFEGAIMSREVEVRDQAQLHFDESLRFDNSGGTQQMQSLLWRTLGP